MQNYILPVNLLLFLFVFGCSKPTDKEYMVQASESINQNNIEDAITSYEAILKNYPESELAPEALIRMASIYHDNQLKNLTKEESLKKSASLFKSVYEKYPDNEQAAQSLFMAGFIYANNLNDYIEATKIYNLFLEKFQNHELASSAREELEYMGLSPEEILKKKTAVEE